MTMQSRVRNVRRFGYLMNVTRDRSFPRTARSPRKETRHAAPLASGGLVLEATTDKPVTVSSEC
jgi:hypothetical protein